MSDIPENPWRFKAVIEGELVHISASFDLDSIELFRRKLLALATVLEEQPPRATKPIEGTGNE